MSNGASADGIKLMQEARGLRFDDPSRARQLCTRAVEIYRDDNEQRRELISALKLLGQIERDQGNSDRALELYEEASALCRVIDDSLLLAHTVRHVGDIYQYARRNDLAERCYDEALLIYRNHPDTDSLDLANAVRPLALLKESLGETAEARRLFAEARDLYQACDVPKGVEEMSRRLARLSPDSQ